MKPLRMIGIGMIGLVVLWGASTAIAEASRLDQSAQTGMSPLLSMAVPLVGQMPPVGYAVRSEWPRTPQSPVDEVYPLRQCRQMHRGRRRSRRGRPSPAARPTLRIRRVEAGETVVQAVKRPVSPEGPTLSEGRVVSTTTTAGGIVAPMTVEVCRPTTVSLTEQPIWMGGAASSVSLGVSSVTIVSTRPVTWSAGPTTTVTVTENTRQAEVSLQAWVARELASVDLGDQRLNRRVCLLVEQLAARPTASIPEACGDWASSKAAYRFFDNPKVAHAALVDGARPACLERIRQEKLVLVVQDTTSFDYTHHPSVQGLGAIDSSHAVGLMVHTSLAVSDAGVPLGVLAQHVWARDPEEKGQWKKRKQRSIENKESFKWITAQRASLKDLPRQVCVITVADREADVYELFQETHDNNTQLLIRASWNRRLKQPEGCLWGEVARTPVRGEFIVEVGRAQDRLPRQAKVQVRFLPVTLKPPDRPACQKIKLSPVNLYAIEARELDPPSGEKPLHWLLLTNRGVETFEQAQQCVRWYCLRWLVERYHFVLKSGCQIEARQLETAQRLERCLGVYAVVAWRLLWLTYQARRAPDLPCTLALETHEWQALYCYIHKTPAPPAKPPSLHQAMRWIAQLGGFLGRTHDGEPGVRVLWRGWQRLDDIAETWHLLHPPAEKDVGNV